MSRMVGNLGVALRFLREKLFVIGWALLVVASFGALTGAQWVGEQLSQLGLVCIFCALIFTRNTA